MAESKRRASDDDDERAPKAKTNWVSVLAAFAGGAAIAVGVYYLLEKRKPVTPTTTAATVPAAERGDLPLSEAAFNNQPVSISESGTSRRIALVGPPRGPGATTLTPDRRLVLADDNGTGINQTWVFQPTSDDPLIVFIVEARDPRNRLISGPQGGVGMSQNAGIWERWRVEDWGDYVNIRGFHGTYLTAPDASAAWDAPLEALALAEPGTAIAKRQAFSVRSARSQWSA